MSKHLKSILLIGCLFAGFYLFFAIPLPEPAIPHTNTLEIVATGGKNPQAKGSEVWVNGLYTSGGDKIDPSSFQMSSGWEIKDGVPLSFSGQPAVLKWTGSARDRLTLVLTSHPWSGIVKIRWNGEETAYDLYSDSGSQKNIVLETKNDVFEALQLTLIVITGIALGVVLYFTLILLISINPTTSQPFNKNVLSAKPAHQLQNLNSFAVSRFTWLWYALPMLAAWSIYLVAYWPGVMTNDSIDQWNQVFTGNFNGWHPPFHTFNIWLLTRLWASPAIVAFAQMIATSLVIAWGMQALRKHGAPTWATWGTVALFCLIPVYPQMTVTLWKDVAYSVAILALSIMALKIVLSDGKWLVTKSAWVKLGLVSALVALYRHNGPPVAFGFLLVTIIYYRFYWKKILMGLILGVGIWQLVTGPMYDYFKVVKSKESIASAISFFGIAAHVAEDPSILHHENGKYLRRLLPLKGWDLYDCYAATSLSFSPLFSTEAYLQVQDRLLETYVELTLDNPLITTGHILCATSYLWKIESEPGQHYLSTVTYGSGYETLQQESIKNYGFNPLYFASTIHRTPIPNVRDLLNSWNGYLYNTTSGTLFRPALYFYLMVFAVVVYALRARSFAISLVVVPCLIQTGIMFVVSFTGELRYQYPVFLAGLLFFLPLVTCRVTPSDNGATAIDKIKTEHAHKLAD